MDHDAPAGGSRLSSSSKFLNSAALRAWCGTEMLRRNGGDLPPPTGVYQVVETLNGLRDPDRAEALITEERKRFPAFDEFFRRGKEPKFTRPQLERCPPGSVGAKLLLYVEVNNFELEVMPRPAPRTQWEFLIRNRSRSHDLAHIMIGGGFDYMGEIVPYYFDMAQAARFFSPELAGEISHMYIMGSLRYTVRTMFHYPQTWPTAMRAIRRGHRAGMASDCLLFADYDPILPLSIREAREAMCLRGVEDEDTAEMAWVWGADSHKALVAASAARAATAAE